MQKLLETKWYLILKWSIAIISFFYIVYHITSRTENLTIENIQYVLNGSNWLTQSFVVIIILMFLNWTIESFKWKILMKEVEQISLLKSLKSVLTGITVSFFSPNRTGEFIGRVMHLSPENRFQASLLTFIGSISQLTITIQAGLIALLYTYQSQNFGTTLLALIIILILVFSFAVLLKMPKWMSRIKQIKFLNKYANRFQVLTSITYKKLLFIYLLSLIRFMVFGFQFYMLLQICGINLVFDKMVSNIAISFLLTSIIPSIALGELGIRGTVNLHLFSFNHSNDLAVLVASFLLWLINLALPALIGAICTFYIKWNNSKK